MEGYYKVKVPAGKLLIVKLSYGAKIEKLQILGDFFIHPEEALYKIEQAIVGMDSKSSKDEIASKVSEVAKSQNIEMVGIDANSIADAIIMAIK